MSGNSGIITEHNCLRFFVDLVTFLSLFLIRNVEFLIAFIIFRFSVGFSLISFQQNILTFKFLIKMSQKISFVTVLSLFLCYTFICMLEYNPSLFQHLLPLRLENLSKHFFVSRKEMGQNFNQY